jgi:hypothetical protein
MHGLLKPVLEMGEGQDDGLSAGAALEEYSQMDSKTGEGGFRVTAEAN